MKCAVSVVASPDNPILSDYTFQTTVRTITIVQKFPDSVCMPNLATTEDVIRSIDYGVKLKVVDKTSITRVYTF